MFSARSIWMSDLEDEGVPEQQNGVYFGIFSDLPERIAARLERPRAPLPSAAFPAASADFPVLLNSESSDSMSSSADQDTW
jgi:hypothetical protein